MAYFDDYAAMGLRVINQLALGALDISLLKLGDYIENDKANLEGVATFLCIQGGGSHRLQTGRPSKHPFPCARGRNGMRESHGSLT